jgi:hypothetical protein
MNENIFKKFKSKKKKKIWKFTFILLFLQLSSIKRNHIEIKITYNIKNFEKNINF